MYCRKCREQVEDSYVYCPNCGAQLKKQENTSFSMLLFVGSIISVVISFIAFIEVLMYIGVVIGGVCLAGSIILYIQNKNSPKIVYAIALSTVGILSNVSWLLFVWYILPTL